MLEFEGNLAFLSSLQLPFRAFAFTSTLSTTHNRCYLTNPKPRPRASVLYAQLQPPNKDVDWIFVDTSVKAQSQLVTERLEAEVQDDAFTLVRTALRDAATELSVVLTDDQEMCAMNSQWRGVDAATDVLSFPQNDPDKVILGDIVISVETAQRQAVERNHGTRDEIRILLVHGLLHLMGYDHEGAKEGDWLVVRFLCELCE